MVKKPSPRIALSIVTAEVWREADALFHRDPQWLGGDDAYSLDLGDERVAWFFGDSFVAPTSPGERRATTMVHNSIGIQTGYDPTTADFKTYWRNTDGKPTSFFPDDGKHYFWPGGSILDRRQIAGILHAVVDQGSDERDGVRHRRLGRDDGRQS